MSVVYVVHVDQVVDLVLVVVDVLFRVLVVSGPPLLFIEHLLESIHLLLEIPQSLHADLALVKELEIAHLRFGRGVLDDGQLESREDLLQSHGVVGDELAHVRYLPVHLVFVRLFFDHLP